MKLKFILPFYLALASITFCSRKISDSDREEPAMQQQKLIAAVTPPAEITGTLELDTITNTIYADLWLQVSSHNHKFAHDFYPLQTRGYKGIAFRYYDTVNNVPDDGKDVAKIHAVFNFTNDMNWTVNDSVRIMTLDEEQKSTFNGLKPYFLNRMDYFKNSQCDYEKLVAFNESWNDSNPTNKVTTGQGNTKGPQAEAVQKKHSKFIPRLTKDDGILSLKFKR